MKLYKRCYEPHNKVEEWLNWFTHGVLAPAYLLYIAPGFYHAASQGSAEQLIACVLWWLSAVLMFSLSGWVYHGHGNSCAKEKNLKWDQTGIFLFLVTSSYADMLVVDGMPFTPWALALTIVSAIIGVFLSWTKGSQKIVMLCFLVPGVLPLFLMDWGRILSAPFDFFSPLNLVLEAVIVGGIGLFFFLLQDGRRAFLHVIWHVLVTISVVLLYYAKLYSF